MTVVHPAGRQLPVFLDELENDPADGEEEKRDASQSYHVIPHPDGSRLVPKTTQSLGAIDTVGSVTSGMKERGGVIFNNFLHKRALPRKGRIEAFGVKCLSSQFIDGECLQSIPEETQVFQPAEPDRQRLQSYKEPSKQLTERGGGG